MTAKARNDSGMIENGGEFSVRRLGFGAMRITGDGILGTPENDESAKALVETALEAGIDFLDTADSYGPGTSERLLGETSAPNEAVVASKAGMLRNAAGDWITHGAPAYLHNQVLCSLDRLGVETIDLYQFHRPDPDTPFEDSVHAFAEMKDRGQINQVGLSNVTVEQLETARDIVEIASAQNRYNLANRAEEPVLQACEEVGIAFIPWRPRYPTSDDCPSEVEAVAAELDATPGQVALAWLLEHSPVTVPIPGTSSREHLLENIAASQLSLSAAQVSRLDGVDPQPV